MRSERHAKVADISCIGVRARLRVQAGRSRRWRNAPAATVITASDQAPQTNPELGRLQVLGVVSVVEKIGCITDRILEKYGIVSGTPVFDLPEAV